jgi:hypothetical protein
MKLEKYANIKDCFAISYLGRSGEYLVQLLAIRPYLEKKLPGIQIFLIYRDSYAHLLNGADRSVKVSEFDKTQFIGTKEINYDGNRRHPVELLLKEAEIENCIIEASTPPHTTKCVIVTKGNYPTVDLTKQQTAELEKIATSRKYDVEFDTDVKSSGLVMGVESEGLFLAAVAGIETILVPTGIGERLYGRMFPNAKILRI